MNVSPSFSPSIKLMKPYFIMSAFFYLFSFIWIFFLDFNINIQDFKLVGWVHIYLLGFVMSSIFASMAQLGPIVSETKHYNINMFKYIWIFLSFGLFLMIIGFYIYTSFLIYGGILILLAMIIYAVELLLTLKKSLRKTSITKAMKMSNLFLLIGIINGNIMAFAFNGYININPHIFLQAHAFGLVAGFALLLIMGISVILIPIFGYSKRISDNEFHSSFTLLSVGVGAMLLSPFLFTNVLIYTAYIASALSILMYFIQLYRMNKSRKKVTNDIWTKSMYTGFISFIVAFISFIVYIFNNDETILRLGMWLLSVGFFGFMIIGNFYKIVPFLIWFQIYEPLIEEQNVPMLHELIDEKNTNLQWFYSSFGLVFSSIAIIFENEKLFFGSVILLTSGGIIFLNVILKLIKSNT